MGIHGFSKVFKSKEVKLKSLSGQTAVIDASVLMYQACLGMNSINALTDGDGNSTAHIKTIISRILNFHANGIKQLWVFDYHEKGYQPPDKEIELAKRQKKKQEAEKKLAELQKTKTKEEELFSDSDDDETTQKSINQQEKMAFSMKERIVNDCKFILNCFGISWTIAPKGFEAEHVTAELTKPPALDNFVYTTDVDTLMYGATKLVRKVSIKVNGKRKSVLQLYDLADMLKSNNLTQKDLRTIGVTMTVLKKYKGVKLTDEQKKAIAVFEREVDVSKLKFNNEDVEPINDGSELNKLLDWLEAKNFKRELTKKQIAKVYKGDDLV
jgi:hypothetical protein